VPLAGNPDEPDRRRPPWLPARPGPPGGADGRPRGGEAPAGRGREAEPRGLGGAGAPAGEPAAALPVSVPPRAWPLRTSACDGATSTRTPQLWLQRTQTVGRSVASSGIGVRETEGSTGWTAVIGGPPSWRRGVSRARGPGGRSCRGRRRARRTPGRRARAWSS